MRSASPWAHRLVVIGSALFALSSAPAIAHKLKVKDLEIVHPNTTEPADPAVKDVVVLMTIHNSGSAPDRLVAAATKMATSTIIQSGTSAEDHTIAIPAAGKIAFSKDGPRIELKGLTDALTGYEMFPLSLTFEKAGTVEAEVMVEENDGASDK